MRRLKRRFMLGIAIVAVTAGATAAVVMAAQPTPAAHHHKRTGGPLLAAADYLGLSTPQLRNELKAGKSLATIADSTPGKSQAGLIAALDAAGRQKLAAASARLPQRVSTELNRVGGPLANARGKAHGSRLRLRALSAAALYLGISTAQLRHDVQAGKTLGQLADATAGKSASGLVQALVADAKTALAAQVKSGKLTAAQAARLEPKLSARVSARVNRLSRPHAARTRSGG